MTNMPSTLLELLQQRASQEPERTAYTFLDDAGAEEASMTYAALDRRARRIAAALQTACAPGDRVLLLYPPGLEYIAAFFGCLYAQTVAVPLYPPRRNRNVQRLLSVLSDAQASAALLTGQVKSRMETLLPSGSETKGLRLLVTDELSESLEDQWQRPQVKADTLAFLQYTSGSTATPKGTRITHGNLLHNEAIIRQLFRQDSDSVIVGWLPLYHDMGLIGNVLQPMYTGARSILFSPASFLQRPVRWLEAISRYRATTSGGPNFAYDLCARTIGEEQKAELDLSSWTTAFNGAEPIASHTLERFADAFKGCGFRREAFFPCYGLAEATLLVSAKRADATVVKSLDKRALQSNRVEEACETGEEAKLLVSCGAASTDQQVRIVDAETCVECSDGRVGEIWVAGPSVAQGYWNRPEETAQTFCGHLADTGEGPFLRTGDLGFMRDGELYVTGRLKDMVIIRGVNHYPQDIERTVENSHQDLRINSGAAFSVEDDGEERLVVVQEAGTRHLSNADEIIGAIQQAVSEEHEVLLHAVVLIRPGSIPKTSSGKIQRHACRAAFLSQSLEEVARREAAVMLKDDGDSRAPVIAQASTVSHDLAGIQAWLRGQLAAILGLDPDALDAEQPITRYGLDSLTSLHLLHRIETGFAVALPVVDLLQGCSLAELARSIHAQLKETAATAERPAATPAPAGDYPLSKGQQALWFLYQFAPASAVYNIASAGRIRTRLDVAALRQAFQMMVAQHAVLRTTFASVNGQPVQRVHEQMDVAFHVVSAEGLSEETLQASLSAEAERPFDLERGPLMRVNLFSKSEDEHVLLLVLHHIITDFWSLALLTRELGAIYSALTEDLPPALTPQPVQYADYVRAEERMLSSEEGESLRSYWEQRLKGAPTVLDLPADHPRPPVQTYRGASHTFTLDASLTRKLKALAQTSDTTLYTTLLSAFYVLLHRYTGQDDLVVGSPTAGRNRAELANVLGYFVNTLVMRTDLSGDPTFTELVEQVRRDALSAFEHQGFPFAQLVERLQPQRDASMSPLFNVMFVLQKSPVLDEQELTLFGLDEAGAGMRLGALTLESVRLDRQVSHFDLTLMMAEAGDGLKGTIKYSTDLFAAERIRRMATHLTIMLEEITCDPTRRISQVELLPADERRQLLIEWNDTARDFQTDACVPQLFAEQARRTPAAPAVIFNQDELTYEQLNTRANQLAHYLQSLGVGPEARVGVLLERSADAIVALLGILKAGAVYVPLDPSAPEDRLAYVLQDADVRALLTTRHLVERVPVTERQLISLDTDHELIARQPGDEPRVPMHPENLAYIIYTSGSTGRPKGVMIQHRSVLNLARALEESVYRRGATRPQRVGLNAPLTFDASVKQLIVLLHGHALCLLPEEKRNDGAAFLSYVAQHELDAFDCTPSHLELLLAAGLTSRAAHRPMRLLVGGEPLSEHLWQTLNSAGMTVYNVYGPTECTVDATICELGAHPSTPVIGSPLQNVQVYLLDSQLQPVPIGVPGEIHIGGAGLARGYLNHPALTAHKFVPNPFGSLAGERLYKTGDMACYLSDGKIKFLGRTDHQVKVRGYRIELGEIEAVLCEHTSVREAVVVAREDEPGDKRLAAYVLSQGERAATHEELRGFLKKKLPDYMIPQSYTVLESLPLTRSGKVDRRALPVPERPRPLNEDALCAPRTAAEEVLASLFAQLLGVEEVGIYDNFFEMGGHSLLATQLISQLQDIFPTDLPLLTLFFEDPTVSGLAAAIVESNGAESVEKIAQIMKSLEELPDDQVEALLYAREASEAMETTV